MNTTYKAVAAERAAQVREHHQLLMKERESAAITVDYSVLKAGGSMTITACQGSKCCPQGCIDTLEIAMELDRRYLGRELPHKFKIGVTGCPNNCLKAEGNDLGIKGGMSVAWDQDKCTLCGACAKECRSGAISMQGEKIHLDTEKCSHCGRCVAVCPSEAWQGKRGCMVSFGGTFGNTIWKGSEMLPLIEDKETLWRAADAAIEYFARNARPGERFAQTLERLGWDDFTRNLLIFLGRDRRVLPWLWIIQY